MKYEKKNYIIGYPKSGCTKDQGLMVVDAIRWFLNRYNMQLNDFDGEHENIGITTNARQYKDIQCYGQCYEWDHSDDVDYVIDIAVDQSVRDMLATVFHECVHLWQWERGHWKGEGEREATQLQYELADEYWKCGNVEMSDMTKEEINYKSDEANAVAGYWAHLDESTTVKLVEVKRQLDVARLNDAIKICIERVHSAQRRWNVR